MVKKFVRPTRKAVSLSGESLVTSQPIDPRLGLMIAPSTPGVDLIDWAAKHKDKVDADLLRYGALMFRGFAPDGVEGFERFIATVSEDPMEYRYRSTPRSTVKGRIYTSTEYPHDEWIPMHNENAYQSSWPAKLFLCCLDAADEGGETPLADSARVYRRIAPEIRQAFETKGVMYVRNYREYMDLPWQQVFQTDDKSAVEAYCREVGIEFEWQEGGLRTRQRQVGCLTHPRSGERLWFNQAHLFHISSLRPEIRKHLLDLYGLDNLPRHALFGDGSPIPDAMLDAVRAAYAEEIVMTPWQVGDIALVDNMKVAHGRAPFKGTRKVVVGMTELYRPPAAA